MYLVQMHFIPGSDHVWVEKSNPTDPIYQYDNEAEAQAKATELQNAETTERKYRVIQIATTIIE